jgi:hypothetical protein
MDSRQQPVHTEDKLVHVLHDFALAQRCVEALAEAWRSARDDAIHAYGWWAIAGIADRPDARAAFRAAAEREAAAARTYELAASAAGR